MGFRVQRAGRAVAMGAGLSLLALAAWAAETAETARAAGGRTAREARNKPEGLPWPEPEARAVAKLEAELREELPPERFHFSRIGPWVIATDLDPRRARDFLESTIRVYAARIQRQLFTKRPRRKPVKVYLFKDARGYEAWNKKLFGERPTTPFGYYSRARRALVMNIGTGGGTLLHEMVHAMAEADFPAIPAWLNEGLGSLFEASSRDPSGRVIGIPNWRLRGLLKDLQKGAATHFQDLLAMPDATFYGARRSGSNYASARYLMQWLQQQGKLETFYGRVRGKKDADARASLRAVFANRFTVRELEQKCYAWVKKLRRW